MYDVSHLLHAMADHRAESAKAAARTFADDADAEAPLSGADGALQQLPSPRTPCFPATPARCSTYGGSAADYGESRQLRRSCSGTPFSIRSGSTDNCSGSDASSSSRPASSGSSRRWERSALKRYDSACSVCTLSCILDEGEAEDLRAKLALALELLGERDETLEKLRSQLEVSLELLGHREEALEELRAELHDLRAIYRDSVEILAPATGNGVRVCEVEKQQRARGARGAV